MRTLTCIIVVVSLFACSDKRPKENLIRYYVVGSTSRITEDTTNAKNIQADPADELIAQDFFKHNKKDHVVKVYTSDNHAPVDGGRLYYTLDSLGIIYERSTTWPGFSRLKTNNDSINDLISQAFAHILQNPKLWTYRPKLLNSIPLMIDK